MINPEVVVDKVGRIFDKLNVNVIYRFTYKEMQLLKEAAMLDLLTSSQLRGLILVLADEYILKPEFTSD